MCKECGQNETQCTCENCSCKDGGCETSGECYQPGVCLCKHHRIVPILIMLFGLTFLLYALNLLSWGAAAIIWPIIVILTGLAKLKGGLCACYMKHY